MYEDVGKDQKGKLLMVVGRNKNAGQMSYSNKKSVENLIRYVIRDRKEESASDDLMDWGAFGAPEWMETEHIIQMFRLVQDCYSREGGIKRYMDHEIYHFSDRELEKIRERGDTVGNVARKLAKVKIQKVPKNNGIVLTGISWNAREGELCPIVYLEPYYEQYKNGKISLDEIAGDIYGILEEQEEEPLDFGERDFSCYQKWKGKIAFLLINREKNRDILEESPHIPFLNLEIVFMLLLGQNEKGQVSARIHNKTMQQWGESPQGLLVQAKRNMPRLSPVRLAPMGEIMKEIAKSNLGEDYEEEQISGLLEGWEEGTGLSLYVLTNRRGIYGAAAMLYPDVLKTFADRKGCDLVILPSSIHEVILRPFEESLDFGLLQNMVEEINHSEVQPEDRLSDHIYLYKREEDVVMMVG